ncbi:hypothetical protein BESB_080860 [Besnoitia besnoiti]|uniref:Transmembrane protein n=1 Tax=Besnoitia besnoiti TaxID=94643 RepID=A0A2A9MES4_BESBE|nr:hypothetical protein BESB_080860 [Besnoitia besnoiti]PFH33870.1 hypothetical protein BESB_080860 [Besnoitia besnoiti]
MRGSSRQASTRRRWFLYPVLAALSYCLLTTPSSAAYHDDGDYGAVNTEATDAVHSPEDPLADVYIEDYWRRMGWRDSTRSHEGPSRPPGSRRGWARFSTPAGRAAGQKKKKILGALLTLAAVAVVAAVMYGGMRYYRRSREQDPEESFSSESPPMTPTPPASPPFRRESLFVDRLYFDSAPPKAGAEDTYALTHMNNLKVTFFGASDGPSGLTPLYDPRPSKRIATVDAGHNDLWIGGGGVNGAFAAMLRNRGAENNLELNASTIREDSAKVQRELLERAVANPGTLVHMHTGKTSPLFQDSFAYVRFAPGVAWQESETGKNVGVAFLHLLKPSVTPYGAAENNVMLYTVAPRGSANDEDYASAYVATIDHLYGAVTMFNKTPLGQANRIAGIRLPVLGGGIFRGARSLDSLGELNAAGAGEAAAHYGASLELQYMYDNTNSVFTAFKDYESK